MGLDIPWGVLYTLGVEEVNTNTPTPDKDEGIAAFERLINDAMGGL